jgi:hypothetical protein
MVIAPLLGVVQHVLQCMSPVLALLGPPAMSAIAPLLGDKRTSGELTPGHRFYEYAP